MRTRLSAVLMGLAATPAFISGAEEAPAATTTVAAEEVTVTSFAESLGDAIISGTVKSDGKVRYEYVNEEGFDKNSYALNAQVRLGYETADFHGFTGYLEFSGVVRLNDEFSTPSRKDEDLTFIATPGSIAPRLVNKRPIVADPSGTRFNQAYVKYAHKTDTYSVNSTLGRQRIVLNNSRHVGNVGWRLTEQVYDGWEAEIEPVKNLKVYGAYIWQVNTPVLGRKVMDPTGFIDVSYALPKGIGKISGYGYLVNYNDYYNADDDLNTFGVRFAGKPKIADNLSLMYEAEVATQSLTGNSSFDYVYGSNFQATKDPNAVVGRESADLDTVYYHASLGLGFHGFTALVGYEVLGGEEWTRPDGTVVYRGFAFPFGTNHKFNGWADRFLATPGQGLRDLYGKVGYGFKTGKHKFTFAAIYHNFRVDNNSIKHTRVDPILNQTVTVQDRTDFGSEIDLLAKWNYGKHLEFGLKGAIFTTDSDVTTGKTYDRNVTKVWSWLGYKF